MTPQSFRQNFPALESWTWLDTPGGPPGAIPVIRAVRRALNDWESGSYDWQQWDAAADTARTAFAGYAKVPFEWVASQTSLSEAATVAVRCAPEGSTIVVAEDEFRSVLFPVMAQAATNSVRVQVVKRHAGESRAAALLDAIGPDTGLVMVSEALTNDGELVDVDAICAVAHRYGALVFANLTQTLGVVRSDLSGHPADLVAAHGYKWMLCPRGTNWLVADPSRVSIAPTVASWKSAADPERFFGGPYSEAGAMGRFNSSPAWMSWIGALAALDLLANVDGDDSRSHTLRLAEQYLAAMRNRGFTDLNCGARSHIVVTAPPSGYRVDPARLYDARVRATITAEGGLRVGFHYFNDEADAAYAAEVVHKALVVST